MLIPVFFGIRNLSLLPASIFLFAIQTFVLLVSVPVNQEYHASMSAMSADPQFYQEMSFRYSNWIQDHPRAYDPTIHRLSDMSRGGSNSYRVILAQMAMRDGEFQRNITNTIGSHSREIASSWETKFLEIKKLENDNPIYTWGYKSAIERPFTFFTYQFVHSGLLHFLMNSFFFLLLAPLVELALGSTLFLALYLFGGAFAAFTYSVLEPDTLMPLVGASGSISFLLGFVCVYLLKKKVHFFYWLLPIKGYYGFIKLPAYFALIMWLASDISGQLSSTAFDSVAHSAHIGGMVLGAVFGAIYHYLQPVGKIDNFLAGRKTSA